MDKSVEKENVTYIGRHRNTRRIKRVSKQILTNTASQFFIAISVPLNVYAAECELFGVRIAGDDSLEISNLPRSPSMRIRSNTI